MKNIHILPTEKESNLAIIDGKILEYDPYVRYLSGVGVDGIHTQNQNIYITSDKEIKVEDYWLNLDRNTINSGDLYKLANNAPSCKKIILTTDQDLIKDGVQTIEDEFLEWFVDKTNDSGKPIDIVETKHIIKDYVDDQDAYGYDVSYYKIIIPSQEILPEQINKEKSEGVKEVPKTNLERLPFPELVKEFAEYYKNIPLVEEQGILPEQIRNEEKTLEEAKIHHVNKWVKGYDHLNLSDFEKSSIAVDFGNGWDKAIKYKQGVKSKLTNSKYLDKMSKDGITEKYLEQDIIMEKEFIPYEQAIALKELGFDEHCFAWYHPNMYLVYSITKDKDSIVNAPLYQQTFRFFREKYKLDIMIPKCNSTRDYFFDISWFNKKNKMKDFQSKDYKTYEEAELECLKKLIELCKKN